MCKCKVKLTLIDCPVNIEIMNERIQNKVHEIRASIGLTQEDLAKKAGVTRQTIIAIEKGNYTPSVLLSLKIAKIFKRPLEEVFYIDA